eukprot:TRINITY_DN43758_c0_g1_i1.p1 TRINITY_DN43758_c0_g1~~TRINITY_DN43758_c0_g1_i1.p1  ORF type:complete len:226 (+),score=88.82 TRINITY_DN43758_c0_g1_i1:178-855(+)
MIRRSAGVRTLLRRLTGEQPVPASSAARCSWEFPAAAPLRALERSRHTGGLRLQWRPMSSSQEKKAAEKGEGEASKEKPEASAESDSKAEDSEASKAEESKAEEAKADNSEKKAEEPELSPEEKAQKEVEELEEKVREKKHEYLLSLSEFENNKKRFVKEREARRSRAMETFGQKMVEVHTEFEETFSKKGEAAEMSEACKALHEGVVMTGDIFKSQLEKFEVKK